MKYLQSRMIMTAYLPVLGMLLFCSTSEAQRARKLPASSYISTVKIEVSAARSEQGKEKATRLAYAEAMIDTCLMYYAPYPSGYFWKSDIYATRFDDASNLKEKAKVLETFLQFSDSLRLACANPDVKPAAKKDCELLNGAADSNRTRFWRERYNAGVEQSKLVDTLILNMSEAAKELAGGGTDSTYFLELRRQRDENADSALINFKMAIAIDNDNGDAYIGLGNVSTALGKMEEAAGFLKEALRKSSAEKREPLLYNLAYMYAQSDAYCDAAPYFSEYWKLKPDDYSAATNLAVCYTNCKKPESALVVFQTLAKQFPDSADPLSQIGVFYLNQARGMQTSISTAREAKNEAETNRLITVRDGFRDSARVYLKRYYDLKPNDPIAAFEYGRIAFATSKTDDALAALEKSISLDPKLADALVLLGDLYQGKGKFKEAVGMYERALEIQTENKAIMENLKILYTDLKMTDKLAALQKKMK